MVAVQGPNNFFCEEGLRALGVANVVLHQVEASYLKKEKRCLGVQHAIVLFGVDYLLHYHREEPWLRALKRQALALLVSDLD